MTSKSELRRKELQLDGLIDAIKVAPLTGDGIDAFAARMLVGEIARLRQQFEACQEAGLKLAKQVGLAKRWLECSGKWVCVHDPRGPHEYPTPGEIEAREAFRQSVSGEGE